MKNVLRTVCLTSLLFGFNFAGSGSNSNSDPIVGLGSTGTDDYALSESICLNGEWLFHAGGEETTIPGTGYILTRVPGKFDGWYEYESDAYSGSESGWYRTKVFIPERWRSGRRIRLRFDSVCFLGHVFLNGLSVGQHAGPQVPFVCDITDVVKPGSWNELAVFVDGYTRFMTEDGAGTYSVPSWAARGTGIAGDVWLECVAPVRSEEVFIITSVRQKTITVRTWIRNDTSGIQEVTVSHSVNLEGVPQISLPSVKAKVPAGATVEVQSSAAWPNPRLWGHAPYGEPVLYTLETKAKTAGQEDMRYDRFGFREFWIEGADFRFNGKPIFVQGDCIGHEQSFWMYRQRFWPEKLFEACWSANVHALRLGWNAPHPYWFDVADETGFLLLVSSYCGDPRKESKSNDGTLAEQLQRQYIRVHRNHPSIIMWETNNEAGSQAYRNPPVENLRMLKRLHEICKEEDPTRIVTNAGSPWLGLSREYGVEFDADTFDFHPYGSPMIRDTQAMMTTFGFKGKVPLVNSEAAGLRPHEIGWGVEGVSDEERRKMWRLYNEGFHPFWAEAIRDLKGIGGDAMVLFLVNTFGMYGPSNETEWVHSPIHDMQRNARNAVPILWPSLSGPGFKAPGMGSAVIYNHLQWWDSSLPPYRLNILYDWVREAYATYGMKLPPLPARKHPEVIVTVTCDGHPVPDRNVVMTPVSGRTGSATGSRTDRDGRAWIVLPEAGRYQVKLELEEGVLEMGSPLDVRWGQRSPGKAGYDFIQQVEWKIPADKVATPSVEPDMERVAFETESKQRLAEREKRREEEGRKGTSAVSDLLPERNRLSYPIHRAHDGFGIDGDISEWSDYPSIEIGFPEQRVKIASERGGLVWQGRADLSGTMKIAWRPDTIFLMASVRDEHPCTFKEGYSVHLNDSVELYIGFDGPSWKTAYGKSDFQFLFCPGTPTMKPFGFWVSDQVRKFEPIVTAKQWNDGKGYDIEMCFPLASLKVEPLSAGTKVGLDVALNDADEQGVRKSKLDWARDLSDKACAQPGLWNEGVLLPDQPKHLSERKGRLINLYEAVTWRALDSPWSLGFDTSGRFRLLLNGSPFVKDSYIGFATANWKTVLTGHGYASWQCDFSGEERAEKTMLFVDGGWPGVMRWQQTFSIQGERLDIETVWTMIGDLATRSEADKEQPYTVHGDYSFFWHPMSFKQTTYDMNTQGARQTGLVRAMESVLVDSTSAAILKWPNGSMEVKWDAVTVPVYLQNQRLVFSLGSTDMRKETTRRFRVTFTGRGTLGPTGSLDPDSVGNTPVQLTTDGGQSPTWSPDGAWIAYHREQEGKKTLWKIHPVGGEPIPLGSGEQPAWSPNYGEQIAFVVRERTSPAVWVMKEDGTQRRCVSPPGLRAEYPTWDPNTGMILCQASGEAKRGLLLIDPLGKKPPEWIGPPGAGQPAGTAIFPVYVASDGVNQSCLFAGGKQLTSEGGNLGGAADPMLSPDQQWIAYAAMPMQPASDLFVISNDGTQNAQLTFDQLSNAEPTWSPDGRLLTFSRRLRDVRNLYILRAPGR